MAKSLQAYYDELKQSLSTRTINVLKKHDLLQIRMLLPWIASDKDFNMLEGCGEKTIEELNSLRVLLRQYLYDVLVDNPVIEGDSEDEKESLIDESALQVEFNERYKELSARSKTILSQNGIMTIASLRPWLSGLKNTFLSFRNCGEKTNDELLHMVEVLRCYNPNKSREKETPSTPLQPEPEEDESTSVPPIAEYLEDADLSFVQKYYEESGHYPLFFILQSFYKRTSIAKSDILRKTDSEVKRFLMDDEWNSYSIFKEPYVYSFSYNYDKLSKSEHVSPDSIMTLLQLLGKKALYIYPGKVTVTKMPDDTLGKSYVLVIDSRFQKFEFRKMLKEVKRLKCSVRTKDYSVSLRDYFVINSDYWKEPSSLREKDENALVTLLEELIISVFGDLVREHNLSLKRTRINYRDALYEILRNAGHRMHTRDLLEALKEQYPECKYSQPSQIRSFLSLDPRIVAVGKSSYFGLEEWGEVTGSIREVALMLASCQKEPIPIKQLCKDVLNYRPDSNEESVDTIIRQCVDGKELVLFLGDYIGCPDRDYGNNYVYLPRSFDEWVDEYRSFVQKNNRHPFSGADGIEGYLYRWNYNNKRSNDLTGSERIKLKTLFNEVKDMPRTAKEFRFQRQCNEYKSLVEKKGALIEMSDDPILCMWYRNSSKSFEFFEDKRREYFEDLLQFLAETI